MKINYVKNWKYHICVKSEIETPKLRWISWNSEKNLMQTWSKTIGESKSKFWILVDGLLIFVNFFRLSLYFGLLGASSAFLIHASAYFFNLIIINVELLNLEKRKFETDFGQKHWIINFNEMLASKMNMMFEKAKSMSERQTSKHFQTLRLNSGQ